MKDLEAEMLKRRSRLPLATQAFFRYVDVLQGHEAGRAHHEGPAPALVVSWHLRVDRVGHGQPVLTLSEPEALEGHDRPRGPLEFRPGLRQELQRVGDAIQRRDHLLVRQALPGEMT